MISNFDYIKRRSNHFVVILIALICINFARCGSKSNEASVQEDFVDDAQYDDGTYCADVTYYNPNSGTNSNYTLNVEIEGQELTKIYWSNGGWLDDSHFTPQEVDSDGSCSFTSYNGYEYTVEITGPECSHTSNEVLMEGDDESRELTLKLEQCFFIMKMTESEMSQYEADFNVSRHDLVTKEMCSAMLEYMMKKREMDRKIKIMDDLKENGFIEKLFLVGSDENVMCQTIIVKRRGYFYLLEVQGTRKATLGTMDFDPEIMGWQEVKILEDFTKPVWQLFYMRLLDRSIEMFTLDEKMQAYCS